jgi:hypothetical protein
VTSIDELVGVVRQRRGVLVVRRRADRVLWRAIAVAGWAVTAAVAFAVAPGLGVTLGIVLLPVPISALVKGRAPSTRIDLGAHRITAEGQSPLGFDEVAAARLTTALHVYRARYGIRWARQLWALEVLARGSESGVLLAEHPDEYALLGAARRVAAALDVPLLDACGREGETVVFATVAAPSPGAGGGGAKKGIGVEVRWQPHCGLARGLLLGCATAVGVTLALAGRAGAGQFPWALALFGTTSAWGLVAAGRAAAERCVEAIDVGCEALTLRSCFPIRHRRTIPLGAVEAIRLSQVLLPVVPRSTAAGPRRGVLHVDLVGRHGRLLRIPLEHDEALRVHDALRAALSRRTPSPSAGNDADGKDGQV